MGLPEITLVVWIIVAVAVWAATFIRHGTATSFLAVAFVNLAVTALIYAAMALGL